MKVWRPVSSLLPGLAAAQYSNRYPVIDQQVGALGELVASAYLDELGIRHTIESQISHDMLSLASPVAHGFASASVLNNSALTM